MLFYLGSLARTLDEDGRNKSRSTGGLSLPLKVTNSRPVDWGLVQEREQAQVRVLSRWRSAVCKENPSLRRNIRGLERRKVVFTVDR